MAHTQSKYAKLWKPQSLSIDKINSQMMFIDNIDALEAFALSILKTTSVPVASISALKAIDTSDTTLYTDGMTIMVKSSGLYFFDRGNTTADDGNNIIAPTVGGGRWISDRTFLGSLAFKNSITATDVGLGNVPNVATNDQTPTYTQAGTLVNLTSGEKLSISFGKIMKAIADFITHKASTSNPHAVTKAQVGLGNVDNTSDMDKPVSTAQAVAIQNATGSGNDALQAINSHTANKSNPHTVTKEQIGLGNVPNVATNDQTPTYTQAGTLANIASGEKLSISFGKIMKAIADFITHLANKSNPHTVTKEQVGLGNVDNTSDASKPVSTAQATAIADAKSAGTSAQSNLTTHIDNKSNPHAVTKAQVGLGNVDNTSDANKPVSTAQATAIADAKSAGITAQTDLSTHTANKSNPHTVTKEQIGLGNVPNVATNDQTPTYTQASTLANLTSGEKLSISFGKIMKAIADFITHKASTSNPHTVTAAQVGAIPKVSSPVADNIPILNSNGVVVDGMIGINEIGILRQRGTLTSVTSGSNFDNYRTVGRYIVSTDAIAATLLNKPSTYRGILTVRNLFSTDKTLNPTAAMINDIFIQEYTDSLGISYTRRLLVSYDDYDGIYSIASGAWYRSSSAASTMAVVDEII